MSFTLKQARVMADLTQEELASKMGVTRHTIIAWETGKTAINVPAFKLLCQLANLNEQDVILPTNLTLSK